MQISAWLVYQKFLFLNDTGIGKKKGLKTYALPHLTWTNIVFSNKIKKTTDKIR